MVGPSSLPNENPSFPLQIDTDHTALSQDVHVASGRSTRLLWTGFGFAVLMLIGVSSGERRPRASHTSARASGLLPEIAFNPSMTALLPGSSRARPTVLRPGVLPAVAAIQPPAIEQSVKMTPAMQQSVKMTPAMLRSASLLAAVEDPSSGIFGSEGLIKTFANIGAPEKTPEEAKAIAAKRAQANIAAVEKSKQNAASAKEEKVEKAEKKRKKEEAKVEYERKKQAGEDTGNFDIGPFAFPKHPDFSGFNPFNQGGPVQGALNLVGLDFADPATEAAPAAAPDAATVAAATDAAAPATEAALATEAAAAIAAAPAAATAEAP